MGLCYPVCEKSLCETSASGQGSVRERESTLREEKVPSEKVPSPKQGSFRTGSFRSFRSFRKPIQLAPSKYVSFAKESYKRDDVLQKRPVIRSFRKPIEPLQQSRIESILLFLKALLEIEPLWSRLYWRKRTYLLPNNPANPAKMRASSQGFFFL